MPIKGENILCTNHLSEKLFWEQWLVPGSLAFVSTSDIIMASSSSDQPAQLHGQQDRQRRVYIVRKPTWQNASSSSDQPAQKKHKQQHDPDGNGEDGDTEAPDPNDSGNPATRMFEAVMAAMANEPDHPGDAMVALVEQGPRPFEPDRKPKPKNWLPIVLNADEPDTKPKPKNWLPIDLIADLMTINPC